jgi:hypothetical protein
LGGDAAVLPLSSIAESRSWAFRSFHTLCEKREGAEGMLEGDALDMEGDTGTILMLLEYHVLKQRRVGGQVLESPVPIDTRNVPEVIDAKYLGRLRSRVTFWLARSPWTSTHLTGPNIRVGGQLLEQLRLLPKQPQQAQG